MRPIRPARRTEAIKYAVRDILAVAETARRAGKELLYLNIGDPNLFDFRTPEPIVEAVARAMRDGHMGYAPSPGVEAAREAIRRDAVERKGIRDIQDVFIGHGASEPIEIVLAALADRGENVLTPHPGYPLYSAIEAKLELTPNPYYLDEAKEWQPDLDDIAAKINPRTRAIVVINPNNPTGSLITRREVLAGLVELAARHDLVLLADEIYDRLVFDGLEHRSLASLEGEAVVITFNGLSKGFLAPGLRAGWGILSGPAPKVAELKEAIHKFLRARLSGSHPVQHAIPAALAHTEHLPGVIAKLQGRRDLTVRRLNEIDGVSCVPPRGAFYAFPAIETAEPDEALVADLVRETGVVVVHGSGFGQRPGTAHFRVVFLPPEAVLERAYSEIARFMAGRRAPAK